MTKPQVFPIKKSDTKQKTIPLTFIEPGDTALAKTITQRLHDVRRLTYMGPTARSVQNLYQQMAPGLKANGFNPICFTARFTPLHRMAVERQIEMALGKDAPEDSSLVLFATSVCRESHNWSWDELITGPELMPNLIQAVGRTDRWPRKSRTNKPSNLFIQRPSLVRNQQGDPTGITLGDLDFIIGGSQHFGYRKFYALQTYFLLAGLGQMTLPWDAQALVDASFNLDPFGYPEMMPTDWQTFWDACLNFQRDVADVERSTIAGLTVPTGFDPEQINPGYELFGEFTSAKYEKVKHLTRLIFGSQGFYVSPREDDDYANQSFPPLREIMLNTVNVSNQQNIAGCLGDLIPTKWSKNDALNSLPRLVIDRPVTVTDINNRRKTILYTRETGLSIT